MGEESHEGVTRENACGHAREHHGGGTKARRAGHKYHTQGSLVKTNIEQTYSAAPPSPKK